MRSTFDEKDKVFMETVVWVFCLGGVSGKQNNSNLKKKQMKVNKLNAVENTHMSIAMCSDQLPPNRAEFKVHDVQKRL